MPRTRAHAVRRHAEDVPGVGPAHPPQRRGLGAIDRAEVDEVRRQRLDPRARHSGKRPEELFRVHGRQVVRPQEVAGRFAGRTGVLNVTTADKQVRALLNGIRIVRDLFFAMAAVLLAASVFLIVNTIRALEEALENFAGCAGMIR